MNDIGKSSHVLKNSHERCLVGAFDKNLHEGYIWTGHRAVPYSIPRKIIILCFVHHGTTFYDRYIKAADRNRRLERFIMKNSRRHMIIETMFFPNIL